MDNRYLVLAFWQPNENGSFMEKEYLPKDMDPEKMAIYFKGEYENDNLPETMVLIDVDNGKPVYVGRLESFFDYGE